MRSTAFSSPIFPAAINATGGASACVPNTFAIGATSTASIASACVLATFVGGGEPTTDAFACFGAESWCKWYVLIN
jgi:hypothetical protein